MSAITVNKAGPINKSCLLFSGGLDSVIFAYLLKPDVLLNIKQTTAYGAREEEAVKCVAPHLPGELIALPGCVLNLSAYERDDLIVPNRNAHLVLLASNYANVIWLSSVCGDRSQDKDAEFFVIMKMLLDHMWAEQHWTSARSFAVESPFKMRTKTELVSMYLEAGGNEELLLTSYSCYEGESTHCGICKPCARKRVALENNGILAPRGYWRGSFWRTKWFEELWPQIRTKSYRGREDEDFQIFFKMHIFGRV